MEKKNKMTFPKGVSEDFEMPLNCTEVICKTILELSF